MTSCSQQLAQKARQAAAIVQYELRAECGWALLRPHNYLSSFLMQWKRLQKSSYQKNMKPVESEALIRLGSGP